MAKHSKINILSCILLSIMVLFAFTCNASEQPAAGIITNLDGHVSRISNVKKNVDFGDDVIFKDKIEVGPNSSLVLTYYSGCRQEWFSENTVLEVGLEKSKVLSGKLQKAEVFDCEVPEMVLGGKDSFKKAAFHFRGVSPVKTSTNDSSSSMMKNDRSKSWRMNPRQDNDDVKLRIWTAKKDNMYYRSGEHIIIYLIADRDAYLKLDYFQADGIVVHLVPNLFEEKHKIKAGQIYVIGGNKSKLKLIVENPYGEERIQAIVSASPMGEELKSVDIIEKSHDYKKKMEQILSENKNAGIAKYALDIWSIP